MGQITLLVCDECQASGTHKNTTEVETWHISNADARARVDLCDEHSAVLRHLLNDHGDVGNGAAPAGINRNHFNSMISTMDEIAQLRAEFIAKHGDATGRN